MCAPRMALGLLSMGTILEQDAADALLSYQDRECFKAAERERWARAQKEPIVSVWVPTMSEQEKQEHEKYVLENHLPF